MKLEEIYRRCGLEDPEEHRKEVLTQALFSENKHVQKSIIEDKRNLGKTTNFIMQGIHNLFHGKSTAIITYGLVAARFSGSLFAKRYPHLFSELSIKRETQGRFVATGYSAISQRLEFVGSYDGVINPLYFDPAKWDEIFDDATGR